MDLHHFEERIKNMFEHHRPETDNDAIWENIEPQLKKKKKRRFIIWFFGAFGFGLLLFFLRDRHVTTAIAIRPEQEIQVVAPEGAAKEALATHAGTSRKALVGDNKPIVDRITRALQVKPGFSSGGPGKIEKVVPDAIAPYSPLRSAEVPEIGLLPVIRYGYVASDSVPRSSVLPKPEIQQKERRFSTGNPQYEKNKKDKKKRRKRHPWEHNFSVQAGPAFALRYLGKGVATTEHLNERRATEQSLESFTFGLYYSLATRKGLVFKTGLGYRQTNEKFHLAYTKKETEQINGVLTQTLDGTGNIIEQTNGNKTVTKTTVYSNTAYNHYRFVHLPLGVGYKTGGKKSRREISGGLDFNLLFRARATMYNPDNVLTEYKYGTSVYNSQFRRKTGMGLWGSYAYEWNVSKRLRWQLAAHVLVPFRSVTHPDYGLVQRYFNVSVQAGLTYQINKPKKGKKG